MSRRQVKNIVVYFGTLKYTESQPESGYNVASCSVFFMYVCLVRLLQTHASITGAFANTDETG